MRTLTLRKDTLAELSTEDLAQVVAGQESIVFCNMTGYYPTIILVCVTTR